MKVFDTAFLSENEIRIDGLSYSCLIGKHSVWIPEIGIKILWSHHGKIESYRDWEKGRNQEEIIKGSFNQNSEGFEKESLRSILLEYKMMKLLSERNLSPPIGDMIYIRKFTSYFPYGTEHCDVIGKYGYEMVSARKLSSKGDFNKQSFDKFLNESKIEMTIGAYNDYFKPGNIVNGYLVDVRRTIWDMPKWSLPHSLSDTEIPLLNKEELENRIFNLTQFPHKQRRANYQTYFIDGKYKSGSRDTLYRYEKMDVERNMTGLSILDLGCNLGSILVEARRRGASKLLGIDNEKDYIDCARDLAHYNKLPINFIQRNLNRVTSLISEIRNYFCHKEIDVVFALSIYKHIYGNMFVILKNIKWRRCYIESHNAPEEFETGHVKEMLKGIESLDCKSTYLGQTEDRSPRCLWRLEKG